MGRRRSEALPEMKIETRLLGFLGGTTGIVPGGAVGAERGIEIKGGEVGLGAIRMAIGGEERGGEAGARRLGSGELRGGVGAGARRREIGGRRRTGKYGRRGMEVSIIPG